MKHVLDISSEKPVKERIDNQEGELKVPDKWEKIASLIIFIKQLKNSRNAIMEKLTCTQNKKRMNQLLNDILKQLIVFMSVLIVATLEAVLDLIFVF